MAKYILKQEAIFALTNEANIHNNPVKRAYTRAAALIEQIKAEDVQPVRYGKWNIKDNHFHSNIIMNYAECSCCGHTCSTTESTHNNYCPNCGADMRGDTNG